MTEQERHDQIIKQMKIQNVLSGIVASVYAVGFLTLIFKIIK